MINRKIDLNEVEKMLGFKEIFEALNEHYFDCDCDCSDFKENLDTLNNKVYILSEWKIDLVKENNELKNQIQNLKKENRELNNE